MNLFDRLDDSLSPRPADHSQQRPPLPPARATRAPSPLSRAVASIAALARRPLVRTDAPETSHEAADAAATDGAHVRWMLRMAGMLAQAPNGLTDDEIKAMLEAQGAAIGASTVSATMATLRRNGIVIAGPDRRMTRTGRSAMVNRLAEPGKEASDAAA